MSLRKSPAVTKAISDSRDADESRRRVAKPLAAASGTSSKVTGAAVILLLVVGLVYLTSSSAEPSWSDAHGFVRAADDTSHILPNFQPIHEECSVWIAASSLKGFAGYGVFTTRDLAAGDAIIGRPDGVAIPVETAYDPAAPKAAERNQWLHVWGNYYWGRGVPDHARYYAGTDVVEYQIAFGALPNHHCLLESLDYVYPKPPYDDSMVNRFVDAGAGAFTYNRGRQFTVSKPLPAGSEIFLNYGYCSHNKKPAEPSDEEEGGNDGDTEEDYGGDDGLHAPDWVEHVYVTSDFSKASTLIWETMEGKGRLQFDKAGQLIPPTNVEHLVLELLPQTVNELKAMEEAIDSKTDLSYYLAENKSLTHRTPEWVRENGMCLENILPFQSTLPNAGQGAFSQYHIAEGGLVIPAPLIQIMDKDVLSIYKHGSHIGEQLLTNYCFGHPQSSLLLCPDTQAELINHCSTRKKQCGRKGPNAEIRWSQGWDPTSDDWRQKTLEELKEEPGRGLAFEVYALRDIHPGEEIFIDYGVEWEEAWAKHVASWKAPTLVKDWITATEANAMEKIHPSFISGDLRELVKHPYLMMACQYWESEDDQHEKYQEPYEWTSYNDEEILGGYADDGSDYAYWDKLGYAKHDDYTHWPCSVLKEESDGAYTVRILQTPFSENAPWERNDVPRILTGYRRANMYFFVKPFAADQHLPGAFRHPLGIRDELFPEHWKNLA